MASAPTTDPREAEARLLVCRDLGQLAPKLNVAARQWIADANADGHDVEVYETLRSAALGRLYFALGRTKAPTVWKSWHAYGLALDVISSSRGWAVWPEWHWLDIDAGSGEWRGGDPAWYEPVVAMAKRYGLHWGGDWRTFKDCPHFQHHEHGMRAVWSAVNAT
jgi:peptidoglycan L-alanyl-D-glutamate endopeptidase CwlK